MLRFAHVALSGLLLAASGTAAAQTCFTLQAELAHLQSRSGGGSQDRNRYERAWREQANVLARTEARARDAGCFGGFFIFRREPEAVCNTLVPKLREMQENLYKLDALRRQGGGGNRYARRIEDIRFQMAARGCGEQDRDFFEWDQPWEWEEAREPDYSEPGFSYGGTYRTLCVRTCDGYYFPISFSTSEDRFATDADACEAMCPGARLYYHPNPGGGPENMTAITGEPYSTLPTAFQYRQSYNASCACKPTGFSVAAAVGADTANTIALAETSAPLPRPRSAPGEDPETLANRLGGFVPRAASATSAVADAAPVGNGIRVVGPAYWEDKTQDGLVIAPVPN